MGSARKGPTMRVVRHLPPEAPGLAGCLPPFGLGWHSWYIVFFERPGVARNLLIFKLAIEVLVGLNLLNLGLFYVGPETLLPLTSVLGAIGGLLMIFWRQVTGALRRVGGLFRRKS